MWRTTPVALRTGVRPLPAGSAKASSRADDVRRQGVEVRRRLARREPRPFVGDDLACHGGDGIGVDVLREPRPDDGEQPLDARWTRALGQDRASVAVGDPWTDRGRGGNAWESNPPRRAERRATGFEDQGTHRDPTAPGAMVALSSGA